MTIGAARIPDHGWNYVLGYHVRLDLVLPGRLALGSELGFFAIPADNTEGGGPEWGAATLSEDLVYQSTRRTRLAIGAGLALPGYAPALSAGVHWRFSCLSNSGGGPCYWLQARADLIGGVPVLALAVQLGL